MTQLRVWAPAAKRVEILRGEARTAAVPDGGGWWRGPALKPGDEYLISLDGGPGRPDPRTRAQPHGVHGPSRWVALDSPPASVRRHVPLRDAVIYELHVGTFTQAGTFDAAGEHLQHLVDLGITHVELMPVAQWSGNRGWGYDGVDLFAPHAAYGGVDGLRRLVERCHERGLEVLLDVVHNHLGPDGAYVGDFGPYWTSAHKTPWGDAINLDRDGSQEVRRFLIDSAIQWLRDYGIDGLRLDAIHALRDNSDRHFIAQLVDEVRALERETGRPYLLIGEYDDHDPRAVTPREQGGWGLDAHWNDDFHHAIHAMLTGEVGGYYQDFAAPETLGKILRDGYALDGGHSAFRGARHGKPFGALRRDRLVGYIQSHDQIGNRAAGERLHQLCGVDRAKIAAALMLVSPFAPMLFQGEEWAASTPFCYFADFESAALRQAVRDGRRAEHAAAGWVGEAPDPIAASTRDACVLRWDERDAGEHGSMLAWYQTLIRTRRYLTALRDPAPGSTKVQPTEGGFLIHRGPFTLHVNLADRVAILPDGELILATKGAENGRLPPVSCALVARDR